MSNKLLNQKCVTKKTKNFRLCNYYELDREEIQRREPLRFPNRFPILPQVSSTDFLHGASLGESESKSLQDSSLTEPQRIGEHLK